MDDDKVIVGFSQYHNQMNELTFLRDIVLDLYFGNRTWEQCKEELIILNKKYKWWC